MWVNYVGRGGSYESSYNKNDWDITMDGVQVGVDLFRNGRSQLGLIFGYEGGNAINRLDSVKADDVYFGLYGARVLRNGADVRAHAAFGWQDYSMNRYSVVLPPQPRAL
jgi:outer membrane autotransporter protein